MSISSVDNRFFKSVCIGSIYRATIIHRMSQPDASCMCFRRKPLLDLFLMTGLGSDVDPAIWALVEMGIGIVSACLPTLRPVLYWISHGHTYEKQPNNDHLQKKLSGNKSKRGPLSWLFPNSLMLSQVEPTQEATEADERC